MVLILTLFLWLIPVLRYFASPKGGFLLLLFFITLSPRYIAIGVGPDGVALTAARLLIYSFALIVTYRSLISGSVLNSQSWHVKSFFGTLMLVYLVSCIGTFEYGSWVYTTLYFLENTAVLIVALHVGISFSKTKNGARQLLTFSFFIPLTVAFLISVFEYVLQQPLLGNLAVDSSIATNRDFFTDGSFRDGVYRAKALFDGPLQLGEYVSYCVVVAAVCWLYKLLPRNLCAISFVIGLIAIFTTNTRSSILIILLVCSALIAIYFLRHAKDVGRLFSWTVVFSMLLFGLFSIASVVSELSGEPIFYEITNAQERSSYARLLQFKVIPTIAADSPLYGFGYQRNFIPVFPSLFALDNYFLKIILQAGYIGLAVVILNILIAAKPLVNAAFSSHKGLAAHGLIGLTLLMSYVLGKMFLSGESNNLVIYTFMFYSLSRIETIKRQLK